MRADALLLGVDGGGTQCRARLCSPSGVILGEGIAGPANIRLGLEQGIASVLDATGQCFENAGLSSRDMRRAIACLALAGASEPDELAAAQRRHYPFRRTTITTDARAACIGAHRGQDGGVIVVGTGSIGWAELGGRHHRVGGWGFSVSDEGSGAWLGRETVRRVLWASDGRAIWSPLLRAVFAQFGCDPYAIVRWASGAAPRDFGALAPLVVGHAGHADTVAVELMRLAGAHVDALAARLVALGAARLALVGGLATHVERWASSKTRAHLVRPEGDALDGALQLARGTAESAAA
jgi:glucosamine kinase